MQAIYNQIEFSLIQAMAMLNLNLTIKESQYPFIVRELVDTFPNESIEDFQLCIKNGVTGKYGKIYNVDLSVLATWMGEYLDEKYQYMESHKEPENNEPIPDVDYQAFKQRQQAMIDRDKEEAMAEFNRKKSQALKEFGYFKAKNEYKPDPEKGKEILLRQEWIRRNFDPLTSEKKEGWVDFDEWKKQNGF